MRRLAAVAALLLALPAVLRAQQAPFHFRSESRLVMVDAVVVNAHTGARIDGLKASDFILTDDQRPVTIAAFNDGGSAARPLRLVFALESSETVRSLAPVFEAHVKKQLARLRPGDEAAVYVFSPYQLVCLRGFTAAAQAVAEAIRKGGDALPIPRKHGAAFAEFANEVAQALQLASRDDTKSRLALVVLNSSYGSDAKRAFTEVRKQFSRFGGLDVNVVYSGRFDPKRGNDAGAGAGIEMLLDGILRPYEMAFRPDPAHLDGMLHQLTLGLASDAVPPDIEPAIRARSGYMASSQDH
ncbi:MAG TPA: hypothetical protein VN690_14165 [Terriglobales bacterium]|nr:hypothetical protein [Terriglobales bacterium]